MIMMADIEKPRGKITLTLMAEGVVVEAGLQAGFDKGKTLL